jgi:hypothetical protein
MGSLAVTTPAHSCSTRNCGVIRRQAIPEGNGAAAGALFGRLMHHGDAIVIQGRGYCTQDEESDSPSARSSAVRQRRIRVSIDK